MITVDFPRTVLSAQSLILGMFPPDDNTPLHVPLYTRDLLYDYIEANAKYIPIVYCCLTILLVCVQNMVYTNINFMKAKYGWIIKFIFMI